MNQSLTHSAYHQTTAAKAVGVAIDSDNLIPGLNRVDIIISIIISISILGTLSGLILILIN